MLEIKVLLHSAVTGETTEIANMTITQVAAYAGTPVRDYALRAWSESPSWSARPGRLEQNGMVYEHDRRRNVWALIEKAIHGLFAPNYTGER